MPYQVIFNSLSYPVKTKTALAVYDKNSAFHLKLEHSWCIIHFKCDKATWRDHLHCSNGVFSNEQNTVICRLIEMEFPFSDKWRRKKWFKGFFGQTKATRFSLYYRSDLTFSVLIVPIARLLNGNESFNCNDQTKQSTSFPVCVIVCLALCSRVGQWIFPQSHHVDLA